MDPEPIPDPLTDLAEARARIDLGLLETARRLDGPVLETHGDAAPAEG